MLHNLITLYFFKNILAPYTFYTTLATYNQYYLNYKIFKFQLLYLKLYSKYKFIYGLDILFFFLFLFFEKHGLDIQYDNKNIISDVTLTSITSRSR